MTCAAPTFARLITIAPWEWCIGDTFLAAMVATLVGIVGALVVGTAHSFRPR